MFRASGPAPRLTIPLILFSLKLSTRRRLLLNRQLYNDYRESVYQGVILGRGIAG